jgi:ATP-dependent Clp protease, protease subunit
MGDNVEEIIEEFLNMEEFEVWDPHECKYFGPSTRTLIFFGEVDEDRSKALIGQILHLEQISELEPIKIYLNTQGGSLTEALAIYDIIKQVTCPVVIIATGLCASAGLLILSAGDYKIATLNTVFFYHQPVVSNGPITSTIDMTSFSEHYLYCKETADRIILSSSKMKKSDWNANFKNKTSFYFDVKKAISFNLIDDIIKPKKKNIKITKG